MSFGLRLVPKPKAKRKLRECQWCHDTTQEVQEQVFEDEEGMTFPGPFLCDECVKKHQEPKELF